MDETAGRASRGEGLENSCSGNGWVEALDFSPALAREDVQWLIEEIYAQKSQGAHHIRRSVVSPARTDHGR